MEPKTTLREFAYRVDADNRITDVDSAWLAFAQQNAPSRLDRRATIGRPLPDFISDAETRHLYHMIFARVRATKRSLVLPFRCDSPTLRRFMELEVAPLAGDALALTGRLLWEEARPHVALLDVAVPRGEDALTICSWCKQVYVAGEWIDVEEAVSRLRLFYRASLPHLTHGICERCRDRVLAALAETPST